MFKEFGKKIEEIKQREFEVARSRGSLSLQQTQRNLAKTELMEALYQSIKEVGAEYGFEVYNTSDGVILELANEDVMRKVNSLKDKEHENHLFGYIPIEFNLKIKNLDYDASLEEELYNALLLKKEEDRKKKEANKQRRIQNDAEGRAVRQRLREARIANLIKNNKEE